MKSRSIDKFFLIVCISLVIYGFLIFFSASLGMTARTNLNIYSVIAKQLIVGLIGGGILLMIALSVNIKFWRKNAFFIGIAALFLTALVFVPHIGFEHGGAKRWIDIGPFIFQPGEFLKIAFIIYYASWLSGVKNSKDNFKSKLIPLIILLSITGLIFLLQPDTDGFLVLAFSGILMYLSAGGEWKHVLYLLLIAMIGMGVLFLERPYIKDRIMTYVNFGSTNSLSSGYQLDQSLIAIGSGGLTGRGFGKSIQKFQFLPEPMGDSIFAIASEEFGFIGAAFLIILFVLFALRGLVIAKRSESLFGALVVIGVIAHITSQSFINISAMLGLLPLSGIALIFVSQGGTSLMAALFEVGLVLSVSKL